MIYSGFAVAGNAVHAAFEPWSDRDDLALVWDAHMLPLPIACDHGEDCEDAIEMVTHCDDPEHEHEDGMVHIVDGLCIHILMSRNPTTVLSQRSLDINTTLASAVDGTLVSMLNQIRQEFEFSLTAESMEDIDATMQAIVAEFQDSHKEG